MSTESEHQPVTSTNAPPKKVFTFPKRIMTTEKYTLYVGDDRSSLEYYIGGPAEVSRNKLHLNGYYYGSGTRIGPMGTIFFQESRQTFGKHIVILRDDDLLYDFFVEGDTFASISENLNLEAQLDNGITIKFRDLHRFPGFPYEISGIVLPIPQ
jgi:hypothetical protein